MRLSYLRGRVAGMARVSIYLPDDLVGRIDEAAGLVERSRSWWLRRVAEAALVAPGNGAGDGGPRSVAPPPGSTSPQVSGGDGHLLTCTCAMCAALKR